MMSLPPSILKSCSKLSNENFFCPYRGAPRFFCFQNCKNTKFYCIFKDNFQPQKLRLLYFERMRMNINIINSFQIFNENQEYFSNVFLNFRLWRANFFLRGHSRLKGEGHLTRKRGGHFLQSPPLKEVRGEDRTGIIIFSKGFQISGRILN